jgi:rare lipoprotein A
MLVILCVMSLLSINAQKTTNQSRKHNYTATYYGDRYKTVRKTASGEAFNMHAMTCAAPKKYKFGTRLRVTNLVNNKSVIVRVTDRGAFGHSTIDLTYAAFGKIAKHRDGRVNIKLEVLT